MEKESEKKFAFCDLSHGPDEYFYYDTDEMKALCLRDLESYLH